MPVVCLLRALLGLLREMRQYMFAVEKGGWYVRTGGMFALSVLVAKEIA